MSLNKDFHSQTWKFTKWPLKPESFVAVTFLYSTSWLCQGEAARNVHFYISHYFVKKTNKFLIREILLTLGRPERCVKNTEIRISQVSQMTRLGNIHDNDHFTLYIGDQCWNITMQFQSDHSTIGIAGVSVWIVSYHRSHWVKYATSFKHEQFSV